MKKEKYTPLMTIIVLGTIIALVFLHTNGTNLPDVIKELVLLLLSLKTNNVNK